MAEYITKEALRAFPIRANHCDKEHANEHFISGIETVMEYAENLPAADVAPVVHGKWTNPKGGFWGMSQCSVCGAWFPTTGIFPHYCPHCGAKMDGGADDADD